MVSISGIKSSGPWHCAFRSRRQLSNMLYDQRVFFFVLRFSWLSIRAWISSSSTSQPNRGSSGVWKCLLFCHHVYVHARNPAVLCVEAHVKIHMILLVCIKIHEKIFKFFQNNSSVLFLRRPEIKLSPRHWTKNPGPNLVNHPCSLWVNCSQTSSLFNSRPNNASKNILAGKREYARGHLTKSFFYWSKLISRIGHS